MAISDRIKAMASQVGRTVGEFVQAGVESYQGVRPAVVASAHEARPSLVVPQDSLEKGLVAPGVPRRSGGGPRGAEFDPLDAYGHITNDAAMTGAHPGTVGTPMVTLERLARLSVPAIVINHILEELAEFCRPQTSPHTFGFRIALDDDEASPTRRQKKTIEEITKMMVLGGGKYQDGGLPGFVQRFMRNSLVLDAGAAQVLRNEKVRGGPPKGLFAYDAKTIRRREPTGDWMSTGQWGDNSGYVQWVDQRVWAEWDADEFIYGVRRPRTDLDTFGYGFPELDEISGILVAFARAENYNSVNFTSGIHATHLLAIISAMDRESFSSYKRIFEANFQAANQKRRLPVLQLDPEQKEDVKAISLGNTNKEMEYTNWLYYLVKLMCASYGVDPAAALGMQFGNEGQTSALSSTGPGDRYAQSKAHGIRIKLRFLAQVLTPVVKMMDPDMHFDFGGFESVSETDKLDMDIKQMSNFVTVNEIRARYDLKPIEGGAGDVIANPYVSQSQMMDAQMKQQQEGGGDPGMGGGDPMAGGDAGGGSDPGFGWDTSDQRAPAGNEGADNDFGSAMRKASDARLMAGLHRDPYMRGGGNIDQITKASVSRYEEALRRGLIQPPANWRPGTPWAAIPRKGVGRDPIIVEVRA